MTCNMYNNANTSKENIKYFTSSDPHLDTLFWHSFWYTTWKYLWQIYSDILSGICSDILSGILSDILSGLYSDILSSIYSDNFWHSGIYSAILSFWHLFWHSIVVSGIPSGILTGILSLTFSLAFSLEFSLACVRVRACPAATGARDRVQIQACPASFRAGHMARVQACCIRSSPYGSDSFMPTVPTNWQKEKRRTRSSCTFIQIQRPSSGRWGKLNQWILCEPNEQSHTSANSVR